MNIVVFGTGYVGLVTGVGFAEMGNTVMCVDVDARKIAQLAAGTLTVHESGLSDLLARNLASKRLAFTTDARTAVEHADIAVIAVGTPAASNGEADCSAVFAVAETVARAATCDLVLAVKSTVPIGTSDRIEAIIADVLAARASAGERVPEIDVASNPEFLREGAAVRDFLNPDRIVVGVATPRARATMELLYQPVVRSGRPVIFTDRRTSELSKYASNAFLATKVSFINEVAALCEATGADVLNVARIMGLDGRIGSRFLHAGVGWGGSCFPKDTLALMAMGRQYGIAMRIADAAVEANQHQRVRFVERIIAILGDLRGATIAVWGIAFKPRTDDIRDAPALEIINTCLAHGATVRAYDPIARAQAAAALGAHERCALVDDAYAALDGADILCALTEWDEFRSPDFDRMRALLRQPIILDGRNLFDAALMTRMGFTYHGIGRGHLSRTPHHTHAHTAS